MTTVNRRISETLDTGNTEAGPFKYRTSSDERRLLVTGVGDFDGGTVTLERADPSSSERITIDSWTAEFAELVEPIVSGDFYLTISGGGGSEDVDVTIAAGPAS
jgi:hypothetical protein